MGVAVLILAGIVHIITLSIRNTTFARTQAEATRYAKDAVEWLKKEKDKGWSVFQTNAQLPSGGAPSTKYFCFTADPLALPWPSEALRCVTSDDDDKISGTQFWREVKFAQKDATTVDVLVTITWEGSAGKHSSTISTKLTNWREQ